MEEEKPKSKSTIWIVIICLVIAVVTVVLALGIWLGFRYLNNKIDTSDNSTTTEKQSTTSQSICVFVTKLASQCKYYQRIILGSTRLHSHRPMFCSSR